MGDVFEGTNIDDDIDRQAQIVHLGSRVSIANTPEKIRIQLPNNGRNWYLLKPREYPTFLLRSNHNTKLFN